MSQLMNRLLKPSVCKNAIRHNNKVRMFSSKPTYPYMLIDHLLKAEPCSNDQVQVYDNYDDLDTTKLLIKDKGLEEEVREAMTHGFSRKDGWRVNLEKSEDNSTSLMLVSNTSSDLVKHYLPPLCSSSRIQNVAISNSPDVKKKDLVVAVKFLGSDIVSLCKPFSESDSGWININTSGSGSSLMYSKKNKKFITVDRSCLWYVDLHFNKEKDVHKTYFSYLNFRENLYTFYKTNYIWRSRTYHLVESPSGEHFLVKWFGWDRMRFCPSKVNMKIFQETYEFLVFRVDTVCGNLLKTEDIGDLCIFLGHSEALCVPASSSPGLRPNSIYFVGCNFGVYDIATSKTTIFYSTDKVPLVSTEFPYWPRPFYSEHFGSWVLSNI